MMRIRRSAGHFRSNDEFARGEAERHRPHDPDEQRQSGGKDDDDDGEVPRTENRGRHQAKDDRRKCEQDIGHAGDDRIDPAAIIGSDETDDGAQGASQKHRARGDAEGDQDAADDARQVGPAQLVRAERKLQAWLSEARRDPYRRRIADWKIRPERPDAEQKNDHSGAERHERVAPQRVRASRKEFGARLAHDPPRLPSMRGSSSP